MQFTKTSFFILLLILFVLPFVVYKIVWIIGATATTGTMCFMGKTLNGQFSSEYPVLKFSSNGQDTVFFNGTEGVELKRGQQVMVLYYKNNLAGARVRSFQGLWIDTLIYATVPLVILLIIYFHPDIIPKNQSFI